MNLIKSKNGDSYTLKRITQYDSELLGNYFENLSDETKQKFRPHPLTRNYAIFLCHRSLENAYRFVLVDEQKHIKGYFIIDFNLIDHEVERYLGYGIDLHEGKNVFFSPSISDEVQNSGLASGAMSVIIDLLKQENLDRMVLLGGTQETNKPALAFFEKFGFKALGGYHTDVYNIDMMLEL